MSSPPKITSKSTLPTPSPRKPWSHHLTLDTLLRVLRNTLLSPFIAWIIVLCLRAQVTPPTDPAFIIAVAYATALTLLFVAGFINHRVAHGIPRTVDSANEVVLVTGGASGLGLLVAQMYAMKGASVAVLDIRDIAAKELDEVFGEDVRYFQCDVGDRRALEDVKGKIENELGTPTIVINCAAARINGRPLLDLPAEAFEKTVRTNLMAAFHLYQVFLPGIVAEAENGGTIVTVSSVLGQLSPAGLSDYSASKAGLSALHRTMEAEFRSDGRIKMLLVETGQMATPLFDWVRTPSHFFAPVLEPVEVAREIVAAVDSGRGGVLRLPAFARLVNWYAVLPGAVQLASRYFSGIDNAVSSSIQKRDGDSERRYPLRSNKKAN
ncbi:putative short-chain dehydrogenase/reductase family protein [Penicillium brasilianum]|uniref:Putative short-chain dehydrogenase/reductase family protein n=1 Tax=Penicillium brasilianum TaxID=104259 RepID=A0A1S9R9M0_PENBI|nr:putative short-chain dehydrogenase/reductase family protein [Penicillium brasilianum]